MYTPEFEVKSNKFDYAVKSLDDFGSSGKTSRNVYANFLAPSTIN